MRKVLFLTIMLAAALSVGAIPARPGKMLLPAAGGSTIEAELMGDEFHHCYRSNDGYIVRMTSEGWFVRTDERFDAEAFNAERIEQMQQMQQRMPAEQRAPRSIETNYATRGLAILVSFSDKAFVKTNAEFDSLLNQPGFSDNGATGSVKDYFNATSYGQYNPSFDVYGPYTLDHNMAYYGSNSSQGGDARAGQMVVDAVAKLVDDQGENVLAQYDCDNDGYVDNVFVYYAGYAESSGGGDNCIWPHRSIVTPYYYTGTFTYGGKTIYDYACSSELDGKSGSTRTGIGAFCHEFSHVLGLPDLYDTNYSNQWFTPGKWDIMDQGCYNNSENTPPAYSAQERFYVGWLTPTLISEYGTYTLPNLNDSTGFAYILTSSGQHNLDGQSPYPTNYHLLENRQKVGWDKYLQGHGMLVWKVNFMSSKWNGNTVNNSRNCGCTIVRAVEKTSLSSSGTDVYPGSRNMTRCKPYTKYSCEDIQENDSIISFTLSDATGVEDVFNAETAVMMFRLSGNRYTVTNIPEGATLRLYDAMGRMLWSECSTGSEFSFEHTDGYFFLRIEGENTAVTLRGI